MRSESAETCTLIMFALIVVAILGLLTQRLVSGRDLGSGNSNLDMDRSSAVSLTPITFNLAIENLPDDYSVLVEFYANWCPHCRHFKPEYDKVAHLLNTEPCPTPHVLVARVDCAKYGKLCDRWDVRGYPTMVFGTKAVMLAGDPNKAEKVNTPHQAAAVINWLVQFTGGRYDLSLLDSLPPPEELTAEEYQARLLKKIKEKREAARTAQAQAQQQQDSGAGGAGGAAQAADKDSGSEKGAGKDDAGAGLEKEKSEGASREGSSNPKEKEKEKEKEGEEFNLIADRRGSAPGVGGGEVGRVQGGGAARPVRQYSPREGFMPDVESALVMATHQIFARKSYRSSDDSRRAFEAWGEAVKREHPSKRCRDGMSSLLSHLDLFWGAEETDMSDGGTMPDMYVLPHPAELVCRGGGWEPPKSFERGAGGGTFRAMVDVEASGLIRWNTCQGSEPGKRGYPCGLWTMFHSIAANVAADGPSTPGVGAGLLQVIRVFVAHFFTCRECAAHFAQECASPSFADVSTPREAVLWLWKTHNRVNLRLAQEEQSETSFGDAAYPKVQWPTVGVCPKCWRPGEVGIAMAGDSAWNTDEVIKFLERHYGRYAHTHAEGIFKTKHTDGASEDAARGHQSYLSRFHAKARGGGGAAGGAASDTNSSPPHTLAVFLGAIIKGVLRAFLYLFLSLLALLAILSCLLAPGSKGQSNKLRAFVRRRIAAQVSTFLRKMKGKQAKQFDEGLHWL